MDLFHFRFNVSKRVLLLEAALLWTFAGGMLLFRGSIMLEASSGFSWLKIISSICFGFAFFVLVFTKISRKHVNRIKSLTGNDHLFYEFFNGKSYLMMAGMISMGVLLRKSMIVPLPLLSLVYITMGIPLLFSSLRFYHHWFNYLSAENSPVNPKN
jgi:hypothetical protein